MTQEQINEWHQAVLERASKEAIHARAELHAATILNTILDLKEDLRAAIWWLAQTSTYSALFEADQFAQILSHRKTENP